MSQTTDELEHDHIWGEDACTECGQSRYYLAAREASENFDGHVEIGGEKWYPEAYAAQRYQAGLRDGGRAELESVRAIAAHDNMSPDGSGIAEWTEARLTQLAAEGETGAEVQAGNWP